LPASLTSSASSHAVFPPCPSTAFTSAPLRHHMRVHTHAHARVCARACMRVCVRVRADRETHRIFRVCASPIPHELRAHWRAARLGRQVQGRVLVLQTGKQAVRRHGRQAGRQAGRHIHAHTQLTPLTRTSPSTVDCIQTDARTRTHTHARTHTHTHTSSLASTRAPATKSKSRSSSGPPPSATK
jgi:hypothetical protein